MTDYFFIVPYTTSGKTIYQFIQGMSASFIGIVQSDATAESDVNIIVRGVDENQSGLISGGAYMASNGGLYYIDEDNLVNSFDDIYVCRAISPTKIII